MGSGWPWRSQEACCTLVSWATVSRTPGSTSLKRERSGRPSSSSRTRRRPSVSGDRGRNPSEPASEPEDSERARFARFAKKLVQVPKKEIDEKAEEWKRERRANGSGYR